MAAYIVFETGHTFGPSMLYPVYRSVVFSIQMHVFTKLSTYHLHMFQINYYVHLTTPGHQKPTNEGLPPVCRTILTSPSQSSPSRCMFSPNYPHVTCIFCQPQPYIISTKVYFICPLSSGRWSPK